MKKKIWIGGLATVLALTAFVGWRLYSSRLAYELIHPRIGEVTEAVYGLGKVKSHRKYEVKTGVVLTVSRLFVSEGQAVKTGSKLIEIENSLFRSPIDGTVTLVAVDPGAVVVPHSTVLRVEDLKDRYVELSLEQEGALRVKAGQAAKISFESLRGQVLTGIVSAVFSRDDEFLAHIQVENLGENVLPGMTADVSVEIGKIQDALLVPIRAVNNGTVIVKKGRRNIKMKVDVDHVDGLWAEVVSKNLSPQDEVLVTKAAK